MFYSGAKNISLSSQMAFVLLEPDRRPFHSDQTKTILSQLNLLLNLLHLNQTGFVWKAEEEGGGGQKYFPTSIAEEPFVGNKM